MTSPENPKPSSPATSIEWYIKMEERHNKDVVQHDNELQQQ